MDELFHAAKNYLDVTWTDTETDKKLSGILERGKGYIAGIAGEWPDFAEGTRARGLLFDYARYARAEALQDFAKDFSAELNALHIEYEVRRHAKAFPDL